MSRRKYRVKMTTAFTDGVIGAIRLGSVVGLCVCGFLVYRQFSGSLGSLGGCTGEWNCEEIFESRWGSILGISAAVLAVGAYITIFVLSMAPIRKLGRYSDIVLGAVGITLLVGSLWFVGLQLKLGVKCVFCLLAQFVGVSVGGIILRGLCEAIHFRVKVGALATFALAAVMTLALIGGNFASSGYDLSKGEKRIAADGGQVYEDGFYKFPNLGVSIERGKFPTIGNVKAEKAVVVLLDYATPSSQRIQPQLTELVEKLGGQLAIIIIPVPLDYDCNEFWDTADSARACEMAAYAYTAWQANPQIYEAFHNFLMQGGSHSDSGSIGGLVWNDANSNGLRDPGEAAIPEVKLDLVNSVNVTEQMRKTTDGSGQFVFGNLRAGLRDLTYQIKMADSNFAEGGALLGMINTAGCGEERNTSTVMELTSSVATITGQNFGYVLTSSYDKDRILANKEKLANDQLAPTKDPFLKELQRLAGENGPDVMSMLPDFSAPAQDSATPATDGQGEGNPVLEKLQDGTKIYGDLRHRSPALPIVIYGADQLKTSIDEPVVFEKKVRAASGL